MVGELRPEALSGREPLEVHDEDLGPPLDRVPLDAPCSSLALPVARGLLVAVESLL